jgi:hypothetical protein
MSPLRRLCCSWLLLLSACESLRPNTLDPAVRLHGHNDYLQRRPLEAALELGLGSVEADVFLVDGELRVGHERAHLRAGRTLRAMYLEPLAQAVRAREGRLLGQGRPFVLLVDIKADGEAVYARLREELAEYAWMLTRYPEGGRRDGAVTVILSGDRPRLAVANDTARLCAIDGRLDDLERESPADLVPWISDRWAKVTDWKGWGEVPTELREQLTTLVRRCEAGGRELRFFGAPDHSGIWHTLHGLGVHRIGSDVPARAAATLRSIDSNRDAVTRGQ